MSELTYYLYLLSCFSKYQRDLRRQWKNRIHLFLFFRSILDTSLIKPRA